MRSPWERGGKVRGKKNNATMSYFIFWIEFFLIKDVLGLLGPVQTPNFS